MAAYRCKVRQCASKNISLRLIIFDTFFIELSNNGLRLKESSDCDDGDNINTTRNCQLALMPKIVTEIEPFAVKLKWSERRVCLFIWQHVTLFFSLHSFFRSVFWRWRRKQRWLSICTWHGEKKTQRLTVQRRRIFSCRRAIYCNSLFMPGCLSTSSIYFSRVWVEIVWKPKIILKYAIFECCIRQQTHRISKCASILLACVGDAPFIKFVFACVFHGSINLYAGVILAASKLYLS